MQNDPRFAATVGIRTGIILGRNLILAFLLESNIFNLFFQLLIAFSFLYL